jgi:hypothetical protein
LIRDNIHHIEVPQILQLEGNVLVVFAQTKIHPGDPVNVRRIYLESVMDA